MSFTDSFDFNFGVDYSSDFSVTCNRCGEDNLHWDMTSEGWRLFNEDGSRHFCNPPSADDFDVL